MVLTDQDEDGSHIKGLLFNLKLWPQQTWFSCRNVDPLLKPRKKQSIDFYSLKDFNAWNEINGKGFTITKV